MHFPVNYSSNEHADHDPDRATIQAFRDSLRAASDESVKFQTCVAMRNKLLDRETELQCLFADVEEVMSAECPRYKDAKGRWSHEQDGEAKQWERFVKIAKSGSELKKAPLLKAKGYWGTDKVQHYGLESMSWKYCKVLGTAASRTPRWEEASIKLNQSILKRMIGGRSLRDSVNPIDLIDLTILKEWTNKEEFRKEGRNGTMLQYKTITNTDLPAGYALDRYGLIVLAKFAEQPQLSDLADARCAAAQAEPTHLGSVATAFIPPASPPTSAVARSSILSSEPTSLDDQTRNSSTPDDTESSDSTSTLSSPPSSPSPKATDVPEYNIEQRTSSRLRSLPARSYPASTSRSGKVKSNSAALTQKGVQDSAVGNNTTCTCSDKVSSRFLSTLERSQHPHTIVDLEVFAVYGSQQDALCMKHLKMYARHATINMFHYSKDVVSALSQKRPTADSESSFYPITKRRRLSLPELASAGQTSDGLPPQDETATTDTHTELPKLCDEQRPVHNLVGDALFRMQALAELEKKISRKKIPKTWGELGDQTMYALLCRAIQPLTVGTENEIEAYFLTGGEAEERIESHATLHGPIITENQQNFKWDQRKGRPIEQLFRRMGNPNAKVSVQKPSLSLELHSCTTMKVIDVQARFQANSVHEGPLNVLDLRNPLPRSVLPNFLTGEDCQLYGRVRDAVLEGSTAERCTAPVNEWNKWRDDEDWVLLAQGGAQTLTHQDSCGKSSWLTVQQGRVGFGWLSRPTEEERRRWSANPNEFTGGNLRYAILYPGQTIYFEGGTIHFVFRLAEHPTLMVGGHVLRWSQVASWMEIVLDQVKFPQSTNEDLLPSAPIYVETVAQLVLEQKSLGRTEELGGEDAIAKFFALKELFDQEMERLS